MSKKKKIEAEICKAAGIKPNKGEDRQEFLVRAAKAIAKIENDDWEALSEESQLWHQAAVEAVKAKDDVPDFDEVERDEEEEEEEEEAPAKKASKSKPEKKSKKSDEKDESEEEEEEEEAPAKKASKSKKPAKRSLSSVSVLKQMFIKDPTLPIDKAMERLEKKGLSISKVTASTVRSDFRNTLRALDEAGLLKEGINF